MKKKTKTSLKRSESCFTENLNFHGTPVHNKKKNNNNLGSRKRERVELATIFNAPWRLYFALLLRANSTRAILVHTNRGPQIPHLLIFGIKNTLHHLKPMLVHSY